MTREEAITVFKAFMANPLFSDVHKAAFNIAIHDIRQCHDLDINNLILINKDNYVSLEQESVLDKIRAEIDQYLFQNEFGSAYRKEVSQIIDKYKAESEDAECRL